MPKGEFSVPGPGFFPTLLGILLCLTSLALAVQRYLNKGSTQRVKIGHPYIWSTLLVIAVLSAFYEGLGFVITIGLFVGVLLKILSHLNWKHCLFWAIAAAVASYLFFSFLLGIQLPSARWF